MKKPWRKMIMNVFLMAILCFSGCSLKPNFDNPASTVKTLETAIRLEDWETAANCFNAEYRQKYEKTIKKKDFYIIKANSGTLQTLMKPIPLIFNVKKLAVTKLNENEAVVSIGYKDFHDKESRPRNILLKKDKSGSWLIVDLYQKFIKEG